MGKHQKPRYLGLPAASVRQTPRPSLPAGTKARCDRVPVHHFLLPPAGREPTPPVKMAAAAPRRHGLSALPAPHRVSAARRSSALSLAAAALSRQPPQHCPTVPSAVEWYRQPYLVFPAGQQHEAGRRLGKLPAAVGESGWLAMGGDCKPLRRAEARQIPRQTLGQGYVGVRFGVSNEDGTKSQGVLSSSPRMEEAAREQAL